MPGIIVAAVYRAAILAAKAAAKALKGKAAKATDDKAKLGLSSKPDAESRSTER